MKINRAHGLEKKWRDGPVIAHILFDRDLNHTLSNMNKLKVLFCVHRDFSKATRVIRAKVFQLKSEIKKIATDEEVYISMVELIVEGKVFTVKGFTLKSGGEDGAVTLSRILAKDVEEPVFLAK